jgi:hypothetical protein
VTLFGRTLGGEEIAGLAFMLATLVLWLFVLRGERDWRRWFRGWEADRKARREAETAQRPRADDPPSGSARGPWG